MSYRLNLFSWAFANNRRKILTPASSIQEPIGQRHKEGLAGINTSIVQLTYLTIPFGCVFILVALIGLFRHPDYNEQHVKNITGITAISIKDTGLAKVVRLAEAFKAGLNENQVTQLQLTYSKASAVRWSNFPQAFSRPNRVGLALARLTPAQFAAFKELMTSVLSQTANDEGYDELKGILAADDYIAKVTGKTESFGSGNFYIAFLGQPSTTALWELQYGGHHFAFANTYQSGILTGVTPTFRGVEPMLPIPGNDNRKYLPMDAERDAFAKVLESLNEGQKAAAKLSTTFSDLLLGPGRDGAFPSTKQGLRLGEANSQLQKQALQAIGLYVGDLDPASAKQVITQYTKELADTYLSYSGSGTMDKLNDYIRFDGPGIWMEYSVQPGRDFPGTTHPHSVWRDRKTDYGGN